jgi:hypothetical protein
MSNEYNGWSSFETAQAVVWLDKADFLDNCQENGFTKTSAGMVERALYELSGGEDMTGLVRDIYNVWISCINFHQIADTFNKDLGA